MKTSKGIYSRLVKKMAAVAKGSPVAALLVVLSLVTTGCADFVRDQAANARLPDYALMNQDEINIVLCGTNSPMPNPKRAEACTAIVTEKEVLFFDMGSRAPARVGELRLPLDRFQHLFVTHLHDDHIAGVGAIVNRSWIFGRMNTAHIYGPQGTHDLVKGIDLQYKADRNYRELHHFKEQQGITTMDQKYSAPESHEINFSQQGELVKVYESDYGLTVSAFTVNHLPIEPAIGYRIDYKGKVIIISGDTDVSQNLIKHSQNADVLIHEVMNKNAVRFMAENAKGMSDPQSPDRGKRLGFMIYDTLDYHTDAQDLGKLATEAKVDTVLLTHLVPAIIDSSIVDYFLFKKPVKKHFDGKVIVGEDGTTITLEL